MALRERSVDAVTLLENNGNLEIDLLTRLTTQAGRADINVRFPPGFNHTAKTAAFFNM